jgi:hypothetical protein
MATNIMLEKEVGNSQCHRLNIITLFESNFNQVKWIIISHRLTHHLEGNGMISEMQYCSHPGKQCLSVVLKKILIHDTICTTHKVGVIMEQARCHRLFLPTSQ